MNCAPLTHEGCHALLEWFIAGSANASTLTLISHLTGAAYDQRPTHPQDGEELRKCLVLLDRVPELKDRFPAMADMSPRWALLVEQWDALSESLFSENPQWRDRYLPTPRTTMAMRSLLGSRSAA